jgi:hypothetical protein
MVSIDLIESAPPLTKSAFLLKGHAPQFGNQRTGYLKIQLPYINRNVFCVTLDEILYHWSLSELYYTWGGGGEGRNTSTHHVPLWGECGLMWWAVTCQPRVCGDVSKNMDEGLFCNRCWSATCKWQPFFVVWLTVTSRMVTYTKLRMRFDDWELLNDWIAE